MPVLLPALPQPSINLPVLSQNLPMHADIIAAKSFQVAVNVAITSQQPHVLNANDKARTDVYKSSVVIVHTAQAYAAVPAWFVPALQVILNFLLVPMQIMLAQTRNHQLHDGSFTNFNIAPLNDGTMPSQAPHNLLPLLNVAAIRALTAVQITAYAVGYGLGNVGGAPVR